MNFWPKNRQFILKRISLKGIVFQTSYFHTGEYQKNGFKSNQKHSLNSTVSLSNSGSCRR